MQQQPLPAAAASTGGRSAAESRTSLSRLCCSLLLRCHAAAAAAAAAASPAQTLARQQGNPSPPPPHHWQRLRRQVLCSAENCSAAAPAELERQQSAVGGECVCAKKLPDRPLAILLACPGKQPGVGQDWNFATLCVWPKYSQIDFCKKKLLKICLI